MESLAMYLDCAHIDSSANVARQAVVVGDVTIGADSCILFGAVLRGDDAPISIGARSNIQDNATVHVGHGHPTVIGDDVSIGHNAVIHGCSIGDGSLVGMGAVVLNGAKIGRECLVGAGALVLEGQEVPDGHLAVGSPAKVKRPLTPEERAGLRANAAEYVEVGHQLKAEGLTQ